MKIRLRGRLATPEDADSCLDLRDLPCADDSLSHKELISSLKKMLSSADECLAEKFRNHQNIDQLVKTRAWVVEQLVLNVWDRLIPDEQDATLVAVGGFGRGELHPHSDVDLLILLTEPHPREDLRKAIEAFITLLWDAGFYVSHSVRTIAACVTEAKKDVSTATSLMEARLMSGDTGLLEEMLDATSADDVWPAADFFDAKYDEQVRRHQQYQNTAYNLEPNIKDGPGGLRDIQMIGWVAKRHLSTQSLHTLVARGFLTESELQELKDGRSFLWEIRYALHLLAGRGEDRLLFEYQRKIAGHFFSDEDMPNSNAVVEAFMQRYYRTVMQLERLNEMLLQLFSEELLFNQILPSEDIGSDFEVSHGFIEVSAEDLFDRRPVAMMELFVLLARHKHIRGVRASTIRLIRDKLHLIDDDFRADPQARQYFYDLLCEPSGVYTQLQRMNRYGVLAAFIPAFENIAGRMQFDLFHAYTVDQHILFVVRNLRRFAYGKYRQEFAHCGDIFQQIDNPQILYLAALFHDIAKGRDGDHSTLGAVDAREFCSTLPMSEEHQERVAWLVEQHLTMSQTAQRRDISDPETIRVFSELVGNQTRLDYLYLITCADIAATSPQLWNNWKDSLLWDLYSNTSSALADGSSNLLDRNHIIEETRSTVHALLQEKGISSDRIDPLWDSMSPNVFLRFSEDQLDWAATAVLTAPEDASLLVAVREQKDQEISELFVYAKDYDGLFAAVTVVIDEIGLDILSARIMSASSDYCFDLFQLMDGHAQALNEVDSERLQYRLREVLGKMTVPKPMVRKTPRRLRPFKSSARVRFSAARGGDMTLMDVECTDRPGLLSQMAVAMLSQGVRIHDARISTLGDRVEDTFIISDQHNAPLSRDMRGKLQKALMDTLND